MKPGDEIWVRVFKADGSTHRWWRAQIEEAGEDCIIAYAGIGNEVFHNPDRFLRPVFRQRRVIRSYYWPGRRHNLLEVYEPDGSLRELYIDIISPIRLAGNEVHFVDHELDVQMKAGDIPRIIDQDEFAEAAQQYGYTEEFVRESYNLAEQLLGLLSGWTPRGFDANPS